MSPELHENKHYDGIKSDMWALGILLYYMICGKLPFKGLNKRDLEDSIIFDNPKFPKFVSKPIQKFIKQFL